MQEDLPLPISGNEKTLNIPEVLLINIQALPYYKDLVRLKNYYEVIDEIYEQVGFLDPWVPGTKVPSAAFCLLFKLHSLRPSTKEVRDLLYHPDSPYIRGVGFLYLRLALAPKLLWDWFEPYMMDDEEIQISQKGKIMTVGHLVRGLLRDLKFFEMNLPRIPIPIHKDIIKKIDDIEYQIEKNSEKVKNNPKERKGDLKNSSGRGNDNEKRRDHSPIHSRSRNHSRNKSRSPSPSRSRNKSKKRDRSPSRSRSRSRSRSLSEKHHKKHSHSHRHHRSPKRSSKRRSSSSSGRDSSSEADHHQSESNAEQKAAKAAELERIKQLYNATTKIEVPKNKQTLSKQYGSVVPQRQDETIFLGFKKDQN